MKASVFLAAVLSLAITSGTHAQQAPAAAATPVADDSLAAAVGPGYLDKTIRGFGKAEILGPDGKTHFVWIPVNLMGFKNYLPFHRHEEDLARFGREPFSIDIDKVKSIRVNGLYQEHVVLRGKRKHLVATRLVNGPVELFNYTEVVNTGAAMTPVAGIAGGMVMGATGMGGFPDRQWFLRRAGQELVKVERMSFAAQMTAYFQDDPEVVAAIAAGQLHYRDMVRLVQGYNEFRTRPAAK